MTKPKTDKSVKLSRDGIPVDPNDWTAADWQDLHVALERAKELIRKRHEQRNKDRVRKG